MHAYDFTIDENHAADTDIALDPELLGKVFENLLASYNPETGKTARKSSGSFYTPREIVDYMVDEALRAVLEQVAPRDAVMALLADEGVEGLPADLKEKLATRIKTLKTLDPACGSGAFPMGLLNRMVELLERLEGETESTYHRKLHLICSCIYGVDIQPIAIQIAKLRFFISLLCDQSVDLSAPNAGLEQLPDLEYHLIIADSLMPLGRERDFLEANSFVRELNEERFQLQDRLDKSPTRKEKLVITKRLEEIWKEIEALYRSVGLGSPERYLSWRPENPNAKADYFDPEQMLKVKNFDIVIGNPPYVQIYKGIYPAEKYPYSEGRDRGKQNLYKLFVEVAYNHTAENGITCLIVQSSLMCDLSATATRELLLRKTRLRQIVEFPKNTEDAEVKVFKSVLTGTCILLFQKASPQNNTFLLSIHNTLGTIAHPSFTYLSQDAILEGKRNYEFPLLHSGEGKLFAKMRTAFPMFCSITVGQKQGNINTVHLGEILAPTMTSIEIGKGAYIHRYFYEKSNMYARETPMVYSLSEQNVANSVVLSQGITGTTDRWRIHACRVECKKRRILFLDSANITYLPSPRLACLSVGLLNSRLMDWVFRTTSTNNNVNFYELNTLPIPSREVLESPMADSLVALVERAEAGEDVQSTIDAVVYQLYGLTAEEIALVERAYQQSETSDNEASAIIDAMTVEDDDEEL